MWPVVGLAWGTALGFAGALGGFGTFLIVLLLSAIGFLAGRVLSGETDLNDVGDTVASFGRRSSS
nr:hypothetical protein [Actinomadura atramentaria]